MRKGALQLLATLLLNNPFGPHLPADKFTVTLEEHKARLKVGRDFHRKRTLSHGQSPSWQGGSEAPSPVSEDCGEDPGCGMPPGEAPAGWAGRGCGALLAWCQTWKRRNQM